MKLVIGKWAVAVLIGFLMSGCSSIRARTETSNNGWTVYPGIRQDVKDIGGLFSSKSSDPDWIKGVMATIYTLDLPFSAVFDTVVMPYDLYRMHTPKYSGQARESSGQTSTQ
ncbi:MAG: YceK/YidQ family lipoprotein [Methylococcales bacterium]|nr:YceK/YidQ family lipoprotein [Methylococcales bacterium]MDD5630480.1 YceK/YidQ family lipoprotein [Methylococcales bacterium]